MQLLITMEKMLSAKPDRKWYFFRGSMGGNGTPETSVICKGSMGWEPKVMETLSLTGEWVVYKGERQFQFQRARLTLPLDARSQLHYVCQRTAGIGPAMEQAIWDSRGAEWRKLRRGEVKKLRDESFDDFQRQIKNLESNKEKAEIIGFLEDKGCSSNMAEDAYAAWGSDTAGVVSADCYRLAELPGYSFRTVDENIRRNFGIEDEDPRRIKSAISYVLRQETEDGSTAVNCWRHLAACQKLLVNIGDEFIIQCVREMKEEGSLFIFTGQNMMALKGDYRNEQMIYEFVQEAVSTAPEPLELPDGELSQGEQFQPDETQIAAVRFAIRNRFAIINGGAGVGKTTVIKMIVKGIRKAFPSLQISLCAPTGKAAARLKEASGIPATTIHVMLGSRGGDLFAAGPLTNASVIVDESSMADSALIAEIVKRNPARLVLVGDQAQLTPVGHGQPFHDIITLYPSVVRTLTKCYRNTEAVFQAATQIRNGNVPPRHAESPSERWTVSPAANPAEAQEIICAWAAEGYLDFSTDIVLCPKNGKRSENEKSFPDATVNRLNEELLHIDREKRGIDRGEKFQVGDRVINTVNSPEEQVWNGTTGTVFSVNDEGELFVKLDVPVQDEEGGFKEIIHFSKEMVKNLRYAYALTVHKSQGSQYRNVVMTVLARDAFQLERSLVYTGVTRTKSECTIVGDYNTLIRSIGIIRKKDTVMQCLAIDGGFGAEK